MQQREKAKKKEVDHLEKIAAKKKGLSKKKERRKKKVRMVGERRNKKRRYPTTTHTNTETNCRFSDNTKMGSFLVPILTHLA